MEISEVRVNLIENPTDRLKAFCSVTLDSSFVIRDIKLIEGGSGIFVAMPSRKLTDHCPSCHSKNHLRARYCNDCGGELAPDRVKRDDAGRKKLHADIAHPINSECRQKLQDRIVEAYEEEYGRSQEPGYEPPELDADEFDSSGRESVAESREDESPDIESREVDPSEDVDDDSDLEPIAADLEQNDDDDGDDYRTMISQLKEDAASRRKDRGQPKRKQEQPQDRRGVGSDGGQPTRKEEQPEDSQGFGAGII